MFKKVINNRTPGWIGRTILIIITSFWCYWSVGEMYHEGWWGPFYIRLVYLIPGMAFLLLTLVGIKWPRIGGWLIVAFGGVFTVFFMNIHVVDGKISLGRDLTGSLISVPLVFLGVLLLIDAHYQKQRVAQGMNPQNKWWRRNFWYLFAVIPPLTIFIGMSIYSLPVVLTRVDDGDRGMRLINGNGADLIWAPEGPGWNWKQDYGGYPSWNMVALYGVPPVGFDDKQGYDTKKGEYASEEEMTKYNLCLYLDEDGKTLKQEAQNIWRMPTINDYARAFSRHGVNAGCVWMGEGNEQMTCDIKPDKETPLWAPDLEPIYYWAVEEYSERDAYFVSYNGWVSKTIKSGGNPRHSYRCVRDISN